jgi:hypothetical protein
MVCPDGCEMGGACEHELTDYGRCLAVEWIVNEGANLEESYGGPPGEPVDGPVEVSWNGEYWEWCYTDVGGR